MQAYLDQQQNNHLQIRNNLFATLNYAKAGTTLFTQAPLASVPLPSQRLYRCNYCLRKGNLQCCSKCNSTYFCSNDCFLKAWIHYHRGICSDNMEEQQDVNRWLLERAALTVQSYNALKKTQIDETTTRLSLDAFHSLELQPTANLSTDMLGFIQKSTKKTNYTLDELSELWQRIQISSFPITDPDMHLDPVAVGVYPITSQYVRHSCRPNAGLIYKQGYQLLVALEDIEEKTPITISYVDLMATKEQRQAGLTDRFGFQFKCDCARCQGEFNGLDVLFERGEQLNVNPVEHEKLLMQQLKTWKILDMIREYATIDFDISNGDTTQALDCPHLAHFICRIIVPDIYVPAFSTASKKKSAAALYYQSLPPLLTQREYTQQNDVKRILPAIDALLSSRKPHSPFLSITGIKVAEKLLDKLVAEGSWVEASRCSIYLFMVYRLVYPALYPNMVYHTLFLSRASWNSLVQLELAGIGKKLERIYQNAVRLWIEVARTSILKTFGQETLLWREVVELKWLFERDQKLKN